MMSQIYSYAQRTCIWLGREDDSSHMAINFIRDEILQLEDFDSLCTDERNAQKWQSLLLLMQRGWFFRRWVVQEIALAQDAIVYCGPDHISWKDFSVAIELFVEVETATHRLSEVMQKDPRFYHVPGWFEYVSALGASLLVEATGMVFRYYKPNKTSPGRDPTAHDEGATTDPISQRRPLLSLEYLVSKLSIFQASEPRDTIYALLAIANDGYPAAEGRDGEEIAEGVRQVIFDKADQKPFPINYAHPYPDVCQDFIEFCIGRSDKTRALDILCRPWSPEPETNRSLYLHTKNRSHDMETWLNKLEKLHSQDGEGVEHHPMWPTIQKYFPKRKEEVNLPSWIPRLSGAPFEMFPQPGIHIAKMGRKNADPLVAPPNQSRNYDAAQSMEIDKGTPWFKKRRSQGAHCMFVKGFMLTEVEEAADASQSGNIPEEWFKLADCVPNDGQGEPNEEFWRTLVADRGKDGRNPPSYYARAFKESVSKGGLRSGSVSTSDLINNERNSIITQFCRRVQAVIWNRQLIKTDLGHLGISRKGVQKGDIVCILYGCSVPVILRRQPKSKQQMDDENEEDRLFGILQDERIPRRLIRNARRRKQWRERPESVTKQQRKFGRWKFGKEDVRKDRQKFIEIFERLQEKDPQNESKKTDDKPRISKKNPDCYYKFLGECYIHGMMDGEAIREKSKRDQNKDQNNREDFKEGFLVDTIFELR
ncbi:hypothetical protein SLS62_007681 [Diatrype stigma]|uniref:Heterokaryon incompatibility domain-containing protein n=1 Tax=Diatrype stigma TaxID=117547 RepID=A0AAN9UNG8_9PEZI